MALKFSKYSIIIIYLFSIFGCRHHIDSFVLVGKIDNFDNQHLYIAHEGTVDSALVKNGKFRFNGSLKNPASIIFTTNNPSGSNRNFYIENNQLNVTLLLKKRKINDSLTIDWIEIKKASGSTTDFIFTEFEKFKSQHEDNSDWKNQLYSKLDEIFNKYPSNILSGDLLYDVSLDSVLTRDQLKKLYSIIDWKNQDLLRKNKIRYNIFQEENINVGNKIKDFILFNDENAEVSSAQFRGNLLLIDFWASWCLPCREEFPELERIYKQYKSTGFNILGVSIDDSHRKWLNAIEKDKITWENVISRGGFKSQIAIDFQIFAIPSNYLLNKEGVVIAKDINTQELDSVLKKYIGD